MIWVLTLRAEGLDHDISWYFDVADEATRAHAMALRSRATVVSFHQDYMTDAGELFGWLVGEGLEGAA